MIIENRSQQEQARILANYLRNDKLHEAKNTENSNFYKILVGLASGWLDFRNSAKEIIDNYNINNSLLLIEEWEKMVGIPDNIFDVAKDIEIRRRNVLLKIAGSRVETKQQFENISNILGFNIQCESGYQYCRFPFRFPLIFASQEIIPFLIVITIEKQYEPQTFPLTFPIEFKTDKASILKLFFDKIKPANTKLIFRYV
tara:strand:+ start:331 stop:930 length:600 start_codon:yes stop_codon:yes gene_type:complete